MNTKKLLDRLSGVSVEGKSVKELYGEISSICMKALRRNWSKKPKRNAYYFSVEFLMGRMFFNNLMELGILNETRKIFEKKGFDFNRFEEVEDDAL